MKFEFKGRVSSSKSLVNRYLIIQKNHSYLDLKWNSQAEDVLNLKKALELSEGELWVGQGGTTLRFLSLYLSSQKGTWVLKGKKELFKRPQEDLVKALRDLGAEVEIQTDRMILKSSGWIKNQIEVSCFKTSQVATGVLLAAAACGKEFNLKILDKDKSSRYLQTTIDFLMRFNCKLEIEGDVVKVPLINQFETSLKEIEGDWSSAAFLFSMGTLFGHAQVTNLNLDQSLQPDFKIYELLGLMGVSVDSCGVQQTKQLRSFRVDVKECPDLFPVLSVLAVLADGESLIYGAPQLKYKETDRIKEVLSLITKCGYSAEERDDGLSIKGEGMGVLDHKEFEFDCSHDHRLVMAAFMLKMRGYKIDILGIESIKKSFPEFFDIFKRWF